MEYINIDPDAFKPQNSGGKGSDYGGKDSASNKKKRSKKQVKEDDDRQFDADGDRRLNADDDERFDTDNDRRTDTDDDRKYDDAPDQNYSDRNKNAGNNRNRRSSGGNGGNAGNGVTFHISKRTMLLILLAAVVVAWLMFNKSCESSPVSVDIERNDTIDNTTQIITSMRAIGEWEFLAISDEELVDTIRKGIFSDDELVRIYYGTVRLGTDFSKISEDAIKLQGDSIAVTVPKIKLLDKEFIDEARTESFFEKGSWSDKDKGKLYYKAHKMMKNRCLTKENVNAAYDNGRQQIENFFRSMGFNHVEIEFK